MRNLYLMMISIVTCVNLTFSQAPEGFNYQSVVRDNAGEVIANTGVSIQFQLHETTAVGTVFYTETHSVTTNVDGFFTAIIGQGTTSDTFNTINWGANAHFLETGIDITGGSTYVSVGTSQFLSVPYALHVKSAKVASNGLPAGGTEGQVLTINSSGVVEWTD